MLRCDYYFNTKLQIADASDEEIAEQSTAEKGVCVAIAVIFVVVAPLTYYLQKKAQAAKKGKVCCSLSFYCTRIDNCMQGRGSNADKGNEKPSKEGKV